MYSVCTLINRNVGVRWSVIGVQGDSEGKVVFWEVIISVKRMSEERIPKLIMELIPRERRKKRTSKKNVDGRSTSSHNKDKLRTRSMEKQRNGVWFPEDGDSC